MNPWLRRGAIAVVAFQVMVPIGLLVQHASPDREFAAQSDAARYQRIAHAASEPYETSEYPPVAIVLFKALGPGSFRGFLLRLIALQTLAQALIVASLFWAWGKRAGWSYLVLSAPMLPIVLTKFDLITVAAAVAGAALVERGRRGVGGALMALGAFVKIWPAALLPSFAARRQWRALVTGALVFAAALVAWMAVAGVAGIRQVVTYRGARGWQIESVPGSLLYLFHRRTPHFTGGAWRVGAPSGFASAVLLLGLVLTIGWVWLRVYRLRDDTAGIAEVTVVGALLTWATLCSPQFIVWIIPWVAIAAGRGYLQFERPTAAIVILTALGVAITTTDARPPLVQELVYLARNVGLVYVTVAGIQALARARSDPAVT
jgi:hypothetical protein